MYREYYTTQWYGMLWSKHRKKKERSILNNAMEWLGQLWSVVLPSLSYGILCFARSPKGTTGRDRLLR